MVLRMLRIAILIYDASGNRTQKTEQRATGNKTVTSTYNSMNQLVSSVDGSTNEATTYTYDTYGNLISDGDYSYTYDAYYNRLTSTRNLETNQTTTYDYYVDGLRKRKGNTYYIWLDGNMVYEFTSNDSNKYTYGHRLLYSDDAIYALNAHGDVVALFVETEFINEWVDEFGDIYGYAYTVTEVTKRYEYDAFGNELSIDNADTNPFRYCGEYFDVETVQIYLRNRYYQPVTGRFSQLDPIKDGLNWYAYCYNNPILYIDTIGLFPWKFSDFKFDLQGIEIGLHWLFGKGEPLIYKNDESWSQYMTQNDLLRQNVTDTIISYANDIDNLSYKEINISVHMVIENGEQFIGYQYLHGTNASVGDFRIDGTIFKDNSGNTYFLIQYTWNDVIDPNFDYSTDKEKAAFADTIASPTDYMISISWDDLSVMDSNGNFKSGWLSGDDWKQPTVSVPNTGGQKWEKASS